MVIIYHNPRCTKSRLTLALLEEKGENPTVIEYLKNPPNVKTLQSLATKLNVRPKDMIRTNEEVFKNSDVDLENDAAVLKAIAKEPILLERPIVVKGEKAAIGRPPENVLKIL